MPTPPTQSPIEVVLFDYGQVLSGPANPAAWAHMRSITALDEPRLHAAYWAYRHDYDRGTYTGPAYWQAVATHAGITLTPTQLATCWPPTSTSGPTSTNPWSTSPSVFSAPATAPPSYPTSATPSPKASAPAFPGSLPSSTPPGRTPSSSPNPSPRSSTRPPPPYRTPPANILFIDDREDNIAAAHAIGMQTIHYTTHPAFEQEMHHRNLTTPPQHRPPRRTESITTPSPQPTTK